MSPDDGQPDGRHSPRTLRRRSKVSQSDLARVFKASKQQGVEVEVIYDDFRVVVRRSPNESDEANEWDSVLPDH